MEKEKTTVKSVQLMKKTRLSVLEKEVSESRFVDCSCDKTQPSLFQPDRLIKNLALSCGLMLVILALRTAGLPESQSVFSALETGMNTKWDESIGKLSFVTNLLPEEIQQVWSATESISVYAPMQGEIVHAWSSQEPYIEMQGQGNNVHAVADGEIMSIAHGMEEERIVRIRHEDGTEALYGNLQECFVQTGDIVSTGDPIAIVLEGKPLVFEYRKNGRSVELSEGFLTPEEEP